MNTLIVARHGETTWSKRHIESGNYLDLVPLTLTGVRQARAMGKQLAGTPIDLCVTSRFLRTFDTAANALRKRTVRHEEQAGLDDVRYGIFEGRRSADYDVWLQTHGLTAAPPGGESIRDVAARVTRALEGLLARPEGTILAVTHKRVVEIILGGRDGDGLGMDRDIAYARPLTLPRQDVERAVQGLRHWLETNP